MSASTSTSPFYSPNGTRNNLDHPLRGAAGTPRIRSHPPLSGFADGTSTPRTEADGLPSPRRILTELFDVVPPRQDKELNQLLLYFGQWVAHDITRTIDYSKVLVGKGEGESRQEAMPIRCEGREGAELWKGAFCTNGEREIEFFRARRSAGGGSEGTGTSSNDLFKASGDGAVSAPINYASSFIDLDHMYGPVIGSNLSQSDLRTYSGGRMALGSDGLPPRNSKGEFIVADSGTRSSASLLIMDVLFRGYHNTRAEFHANATGGTDEDLFQAARMDTIAAYQKMVEELYLPAVLGEVLDEYTAYDDAIDPSVDVFFSTCSFRYGHSGISGRVRVVDRDFAPTGRDPILLRDAFGRPEWVVDQAGGGLAGAAALLRGMASEPARAIDASFEDDMSYFTDAMTVKNVQRGRDNGLPAYNDAREWFNLSRVDSFKELANGDDTVAAALAGLYQSVGDVDPFVGGLLEKPADPSHELGPLMTASMKEQFTRIRNGDRLWYKLRLTQEEISKLPSLSDMIKAVFGDDEMRNFPTDAPFAVAEPLSAGKEQCFGSNPFELSLMKGKYTFSWTMPSAKKNTKEAEMTLSVNELVGGGYIGIGWGARSMHDADIWFCTTAEGAKVSSSCSAPSPGGKRRLEKAPDPRFQCCIAKSMLHSVPRCNFESSSYSLQVVDWCLSEELSFVTVSVPVCEADSDSPDCFSVPEGNIDYIAAYNPDSPTGPHGFSRRTNGEVNLNAGHGSAESSASSNVGLFVLHGAGMLVCWFVLVPAAVFIVRYMKGKTWRLTAHIALVGLVGSLMLSLALAALVSAEGAAFGTVDGGSNFSHHKAGGIAIVIIVGFQLGTGEIRRTREINNLFKNPRVERLIFIVHRLGGFTLAGLSWWNCYTGLIQIAPYEGDDVELTVFGTFSTGSLGYDVEFFGFFKQYIYFPWIAAIILVFIVTEFRVRRSIGSKHRRRLEAVKQGVESLWGSEPVGDRLGTMSTEVFLDLTRHGSPFCVVDGYVVDIGSFMNVHPGGRKVLGFAIGSDITQHLLGEHDVEGIRHVHSPTALQMLRKMVKARLEGSRKSLSSRGLENLRQSMLASMPDSRPKRAKAKMTVFRDAKVVKHEFVSAERSLENKPVLRICLAVKRRKEEDVITGTPPPSTTFIFRGKGPLGEIIERSYTTIKCSARRSGCEEGLPNTSASPLPVAYLPAKADSFTRLVSTQSFRKTDEVCYDFLMNLLPQGKMSSFLRKMKPGSHLMVQGPLAENTAIKKLESRQWEVAVLIAQGTGITPMIQLIDYFLYGLGHSEQDLSEPPKFDHGRTKIFLVWFIKNESNFEGAAELRERATRSLRSFNYVIVDTSAQFHPSTSNQSILSDEAETLDVPSSSPGMGNGGHLSTIAEGGENESPSAQMGDTDSGNQSNEKECKADSMGNSSNGDTTPVSVPVEARAGLSSGARGNTASAKFQTDLDSFLDRYYMKKRLDAELAARLLSLATGRTTPDFVPWGSTFSDKMDINEKNIDDEKIVHTEYNNTLVAVCGSTHFDDDTVSSLEDLGLGPYQILTFHDGDVPLSNIDSLHESTSRKGSKTKKARKLLGARGISSRIMRIDG